MAIDTSLLVSAAILQDYLVDKSSGLPLASGIVSLYQDNSRTTFKNWYYQSGSPGAYTYITLPNPMTLSAVGTITDGNGNDVIPFFYPYDENDQSVSQTYYITVDNSNLQRQFTRQNFPFGAYESNITPAQTGLTLKNYVVNNVFWRNIGTLNATNVTLATIAPSAHDGFAVPDWSFGKSTTGAIDTLTFTKFAAGQFLNASNVNPQNLDVTPEYFLNFTCSGTGAETYKVVEVPISLHIKTLEDVPVTIKLFARCNSSGGTGGNVISVSIFQFAGIGVISPPAVIIESFDLPIEGSSTAPFTELTFPFTIPSAAGVSVNGLDDSIYLQINYPLGQTFSIDIAKVSLYIGNTVPNNDYDTYDIVDSIICSPRTGDIRQSMNNYQPYGWVPLNNGTIGSSGSGATTRANSDTWPLYNLLYSSVNQVFVPVSGYTGTAITDFNANRPLMLTSALGQVLMGLPPVVTVTGYVAGSPPAWGIVNGYFTVGSTVTSLLYQGAPVILTGTALNSAFTSGTIYYVVVPLDGSSTASFQLATTYVDAILAGGNQAAHIIPSSGVATGSGITLTFPLGGNFGQPYHTQLVPELAAHYHLPGAAGATGFGYIGGVGSNTVGGGGAANSAATAITGSNYLSNLIQPSLYTNIFIKL
jgi:hypothetical protein